MTYLLKPTPNGSMIEIDPQLLSDAGIAADARWRSAARGARWSFPPERS